MKKSSWLSAALIVLPLRLTFTLPLALGLLVGTAYGAALSANTILFAAASADCSSEDPDVLAVQRRCMA